MMSNFVGSKLLEVTKKITEFAWGEGMMHPEFRRRGGGWGGIGFSFSPLPRDSGAPVGWSCCRWCCSCCRRGRNQQGRAFKKKKK